MEPDESTFSALFERHRRELQTHCYRMVVIHWDRPELFEAFGLPMSFPGSRRSNKEEVNPTEVR